MASAFDILALEPLGMRGPSQRWDAAIEETPEPRGAILRAAWGAATIGEAFFAGYQGALDVLIGGGRSKAILVTELTGQRPKDLTCRIEHRQVHGSKAFAMLDVEEWWVAAHVGEDDLRLARVSPTGSGVQVTPMKTSFLADVPHGSVRFDGCASDKAIKDAWNLVVRPFRAVEDTGVLLALTTALLGAVSNADMEDELLGILAALFHLFGRTDDASYRAVIGARGHLLDIAGRAELVGPLASSWAEHEPLVNLAQTARKKRLERARERTRFMAW